MSKSVLPYDKTLPFNPERNSWEEPHSYLVKDGTSYKVVRTRRPSKMLVVDKLREAVNKWRSSGYKGASDTTQKLLTFWFEEDHLVDGYPFRYYFCQREAIETLVYLVEIEKFSDLVPVFRKYATLYRNTLFNDDFVFETPDGKRSIRRYFPELENEGTQEIPDENLLRYAIKMATGSGKTVVMALVMAWSYFNKTREGNANMADNFLLVAPNVIVLERLQKDFVGNAIFKRLPLIPPYLKSEWSLKVLTRGDASVPNPSGNLFLQNIQQLYESRQADRCDT